MDDVRQDRSLRIALAAGGTGGHIMPALALAEALHDLGQPTEIDFICGNRPVERDIYARSHIAARALPLGPMTAGGFLRRAGQSLAFSRGFLQALSLVSRYDVVVGMGGYVTGPVLAAAWLRGVPIVVHESNAVLGRVNRWMARRVRVIACGFPLVKAPSRGSRTRIVEIGTPVRPSIGRCSRDEGARHMQLRPDAFTLLITGGSQGAQSLNDLVARSLGNLDTIWPTDKSLQVVWATGPKNLGAVRAAMAERPFRGHLRLVPDIERMDCAYALADLVIGRAGAATLAELLVCGLPSILFPLPIAMERHQHRNAEALTRHDAAIVFEQSRTTPEDLAKTIAALAGDPARLRAMSEAARKLARPQAAHDLARIVVETARGKNPKK